MPINKEVLDFLLDKLPSYAVCGVDVGAHTGEVSMALADKGLTVYAIDKVQSFEDPRIYMRVGDSVEMAENFMDRSVDIAFIDAGKKYHEVMADLEAWYPKVRGLICGYDCEVKYSDKNSDTQELIDEFADQEGYAYPWLHCGIIKGVHDFFKGEYGHDKYHQAWWKYL